LWSAEEAKHHVNWLELMAAFLALRCFIKDQQDLHVQLFMDNRVAIAYVNRLGGSHSRSLCYLALEIWKWCVQRKVSLYVVHIPGKANVIADWESRHVSDYSDWKLNQEVFERIQNMLGPFSVDLFANYRNAQLRVYFSWRRPDPSAAAVDTLSQSWSNHHPYLFPPFALIGRCLHKIKRDRIWQAVLIAPLWPTQAWFPTLASMLVQTPILLPTIPNLLTDHQGQPHPMITQGHLTLVAWPVSGVSSRIKEFLQNLPPSSVPLGGRTQLRLTKRPGEDGFIGVTSGRLIHAQPLSEA